MQDALRDLEDEKEARASVESSWNPLLEDLESSWRKNVLTTRYKLTLLVNA